MADLQRGYTFTDGGTGTAANLHSLVDAGTILPAFISGKTAVTDLSDLDYFCLYQAGSQALRKVSFLNFKNSFPKGGSADTFCLRKLGVGATDAAAGNDSRFPTRITGIRKGNGTASDTAAAPKDFIFTPQNLTGTANTLIDWSLADEFYDNLSGDKAYSFANVTDGRIITVAIQVNGHNITWPSLFGTVPAIDNTATVHYFTFVKTPLNGSPSGLVVAI